ARVARSADRGRWREEGGRQGWPLSPVPGQHTARQPAPDAAGQARGTPRKIRKQYGAARVRRPYASGSLGVTTAAGGSSSLHRLRGYVLQFNLNSKQESSMSTRVAWGAVFLVCSVL